MVSALLLLATACGCAKVASATAAVAMPAPSTGFITRVGAELRTPDGAAFRYGGNNMYWLGLDENEGGVDYPTKYRIEDGLRTAVGMGTAVIRSHSLGVSTGHPKAFEPALGVFNDTALDAADYAVYMAEQLGLRLIVPLTDNYKYYTGGYHDFTDWLGLPMPSFYTDQKAIAAFTTFISKRLHHVNPYTKRKAIDEPAIMAWETGNELKPPASWTKQIAAFIKNIDPNHLVMDGTYGINPAALEFPEVDLYSDHFYPMNSKRMIAGARAVANAKKVYIAGEYSWKNPELTMGFLTAAQENKAVSGTQYWSLFPHADGHGFVQHGDGFTVHYPGDNTGCTDLVPGGPSAKFTCAFQKENGKCDGGPFPGNKTTPLPNPWMVGMCCHTCHADNATACDDCSGANTMAKFVQQFSAHATAMSAIPSSPIITKINCSDSDQKISLAWEGGAMAATYNVETAASVSGPWIVDQKGVTDNDTPIQLSIAQDKAVVWIRVQPVSLGGTTGNYSAACHSACGTGGGAALTLTCA